VLTPAQALRRILRRVAEVSPLPAERVTLAQALGRALSEDVRAGRDLPAFDNAQMDGYALRAADAPRADAVLPVAFEVFAGDRPGRSLPPGTCARIFTGAPVPGGADCVEMQEEVRRRGRSARFRRAAVRGRFVRAAGSDVARGAVVARRGDVVDPGTIGLAAALGRAELAVPRRPRVGVLATGNEVVALGGPIGPGEIFDSNSHALAAACADAGAVPTLLPIARDDIPSLRRALDVASGLDALVTTGGVSVGDRDLVKKALAEAGARLDFWRVAMRPGKPFAFGTWGRMPFFGLPGNPASALVAFEIFARPALRALQGLCGSGRLRVRARLAVAQEKPAGQTVFLRCRLEGSEGDARAEPLASQQSGHLASVAGLDALAVLPAGRARLRAGTLVEVVVLRSSSPSVRPGARIG